MTEDLRGYIQEIGTLTGETYKGITLAAGYIAGFFDILKVDSPTTPQELAKRKGYDAGKVEKWLHFASELGIVRMDEHEGITLTAKGLLLSSASPVKDMLAFIDGVSFLIRAADRADSTFKPNQSLDKLSDGKISREYQPKVSDNFSATFIEHVKKFDLAENDRLLDVGSGNGSFIRSLCKALPSMTFTGVDLNLFAIEKAKKENISLGLSDRIKMVVGDIMEDLDDFPDNSYEWVTAINVMHFLPVAERDNLVRHLVRIARRGVFFNICLSDSTMIALSAHCMMSLLWNDFTGFYTPPEAELFFKELPQKYRNMEISTQDMMQGSSKLVTVLKR